MAKRIFDGLTPMFDWLLVTGSKPSTATTAVSCVRSALRTMGCEPGVVPTVAQLNLVFGDIDTARPGSASNVRAAWRRYAEWMSTEHGTAIPLPAGIGMAPTDRKPDARNVVPLLPEVRDALQALMQQGISVNRIHVATWEDIDFDSAQRTSSGETTLLIRDPTKSTSIRIPLSIIEPLAEYAQAGTAYGNPLVPFCPGSSLPYPLAVLRRELATRRESVTDRTKRLRDLNRGSGPPGSALGGYANYDAARPLNEALEALRAPPPHEALRPAPRVDATPPPTPFATLDGTLAALGARPASEPAPVLPAKVAAMGDLPFESPDELFAIVGQLVGLSLDDVKARLT